MNLHETARDQYNNGNYKEALDLWLQQSEQGDSEAQAWLGSLYANGEGVEVDDYAAFSWYLKSAEQGNHQAQANVGAFYHSGRGVDKDDSQAFSWLSTAAEGGDINGLFNLAVLCSKGEGCEKNDEKSLELYHKAAERGHYPSQSRLGFMYAHGIGAKKDRVQAYLWLTLAAQHGIGSALTALEGVVEKMSSEEKEAGAQLFDHWRKQTGTSDGPVALYPMPS